MQLGIVGSVLLLLPFLLIFQPSSHCPSPHDAPIQLKNNIDDQDNDGDDHDDGKFKVVGVDRGFVKEFVEEKEIVMEKIKR